MKAEHRRELKTNELAEWITSLPQWAHENLKMIIYVSAAFILATGSYLYHRYQKTVVLAQKQVEFTNIISNLSRSELQILRSQSEGKDDSIMLLHIAENLRSSAQNTKNAPVEALALVKQGQALRMELHYRPGTITSQDHIAQISRSKACYTEALTKAPGNPTLVSIAKLGLGLCEEELGNFETARNIYNDIATNPDFEATTARTQAQYRLATMDDYRQKVVLKAPEPPPGTEPGAVQPLAEPVPQIKLQVPQPVPSSAGHLTVEGQGESNSIPRSAAKDKLPGK